MRLAVLLALAALAGCATIPSQPEVIAYQAPAAELVQHMPEGVPGPLSGLRAFTVSCGTSATPISDSVPYHSLYLWNNSATPIYLGASNVTASTTNGMPICTDTASCPRADLPADARHGFCRVGSGTVSLVVLAGAQ